MQYQGTSVEAFSCFCLSVKPVVSTDWLFALSVREYCLGYKTHNQAFLLLLEIYIEHLLISKMQLLLKKILKSCLY